MIKSLSVIGQETPIEIGKEFMGHIVSSIEHFGLRSTNGGWMAVYGYAVYTKLEYLDGEDKLMAEFPFSVVAGAYHV